MKWMSILLLKYYIKYSCSLIKVFTFELYSIVFKMVNIFFNKCLNIKYKYKYLKKYIKYFHWQVPTKVCHGSSEPGFA